MIMLPGRSMADFSIDDGHINGKLRKGIQVTGQGIAIKDNDVGSITFGDGATIALVPVEEMPGLSTQPQGLLAR